jgi:hypothetical protein
MITQGLTVIAAFMKEQFIKELVAQQHVASGDLIDSIKFDVKNLGDKFEITFTALDYGIPVDTGTKAGRWIPIDALIEWVSVKGIATGDKEIKSAAYAIRRKIFQEGTPTKGSMRFTNNGRKKNWIGFAIEDNQAELTQRFVSLIGKEIGLKLNKVATAINNA